MRITLLLIATRNYKPFVAPLLDGVQKHFFPNDEVNVIIFTDEVSYLENFQKPENRGRLNIGLVQIRALGFPEATLYRYKIFSTLNKEIVGDYCFYMDVDMKLVADVGREILGSLVAVRHPAFYNRGWGSPNCDERSTGFVPKKQWFNYVAGGFQGGKTESYLHACGVLARHIEQDEKIGVLAEWHDETHWNWLLKNTPIKPKYLDSGYCMVEEEERRIKWGINHLEPKIIALTKNHAEIRA